MITLRFVLLALLPILTMAACNTAPAATAGPGGPLSSTIANSDWVLGTLADTPLPSGTPITLQFAFVKAAGFGGCNQYSASYSSDGASTLTFGAIAATRMACAGGDAFESAYFAALERVRKYVIEGSTLILSGESGGALLTYGAAAPASVEGPWMVTAVNNGAGGVSSVPAGISAAMSFLNDGTMEGFGGCNDFGGPYTVDGDSITIGPLMSTMKACSDDINAFESQFMTALANSTQWSVNAGTLDLRDGDDAQQVGATSAIGR